MSRSLLERSRDFSRRPPHSCWFAGKNLMSTSITSSTTLQRTLFHEAVMQSRICDRSVDNHKKSSQTNGRYKKQVKARTDAAQHAVISRCRHQGFLLLLFSGSLQLKGWIGQCATKRKRMRSHPTLGFIAIRLVYSREWAHAARVVYHVIAAFQFSKLQSST